MKKTLTIFTGFVHDFTAGCWAAIFFTIYWIHSLHSGNNELDPAFVSLESQFFYIGLTCAGIVLLTGMGRTFTYIENFYGKDAEKLRRKMLMAKHALLLGIFGGGTYWQYMMVFE